MKSALAGLDGGATFTQGHELDEKTAKKVPRPMLGK